MNLDLWILNPTWKALEKGRYVMLKGVGPSTTLAWPGWKQPDIPVEVDTARLETSHTDTVKELPGYPVQNCPSGSFLL